MVRRRIDGMEIGKHVRDIRMSQGLHMTTLADRAGVTYSTLANLEKGHIQSPSAVSLYKIAKALNVPFGVLMGDTEDVKDRLSFLPDKYASVLSRPDFLPYLSAAIRAYEAGFDAVALARIIESVKQAHNVE